MTQQHGDQGGKVMEIPGHHWKEEDRVQEYITRTDTQAEQRRAVFDLMLDVFPFESDAAIRVLDIGSGYGAVASAVLDRFPNATATGLDISEPMMEEGKQRMARYGKRFQYHIGDFAEGTLPADLDGRFDAVVSAAAIHHLPSEAKQRFYKEIFARLNEGGCFFNVDLVSAPEDHGQQLYREARERERVRRNEPPRPPRRDSDHLTHHHIETVPDQTAWLRAGGFVGVDCFYKRLGDTIIGGYKPGR